LDGRWCWLGLDGRRRNGCLLGAELTVTFPLPDTVGELLALTPLEELGTRRAGFGTRQEKERSEHMILHGHVPDKAK